MPTFNLTTNFTAESLQVLHDTGTNVVVAKPTPGSGTPNVAWVVYYPLQVNAMDWEEKYGIYASTQLLTNGATLSQMSATNFPAAAGQKYTFGPAGYFNPPVSGGTPGSFVTFNEYSNSPYLTFGLYQNATVNGAPLVGNAVSAAPVLYQSTATMTPYTTIFIWTQSQVKSNTVCTNVTSAQTEVVFGGDVTSVELDYDPSTGTFVNVGASIEIDGKTGKLVASGGEALSEGVSLRHHLPALI